MCTLNVDFDLDLDLKSRLRLRLGGLDCLTGYADYSSISSLLHEAILY